MNQRLSRAAVVAAILAGWGRPVLAQTQPAPDTRGRGVYRGDTADENSRQSLLLSGAFYGAYDSNIIGSEGAAITPVTAEDRVRGLSTRGEGRLSYFRRADDVRFAAAGGVHLDYYPDLAGVDQPIDSYDGSGDVTFQFGRSSLRLSQLVLYQPYFTLQQTPVLFSSVATAPELGPALAADVTLFSQPVTAYGSSARFSTPLTRRVSIEGSLALNGSSSPAHWTDVQDKGGSLNATISTSRRSGLTLGYSRRLTTYRPLDRPRLDISGQEFQIGYTYRRALSPTRAFGFEAGTGGALLNGDVNVPGQEETKRQVLGYGGISYQFARSWETRGHYRRSLQVLRGLTGTFYGDSVTASLDGLLSREVSLTSTVSFSNGDSGLSTFSQAYDTRSAAVRLRYAFTRHVALSAEYIYSFYKFGALVELPPGVLREVDRNIIRAGVTFGMPLIGR